MRAGVLVVPIGVSAAAGIGVSRVLARPYTAAGEVGWWTVILTVSTIVLLVTDRLARRLLPLAALLRLTLVFPDRAPSRFTVALRSHSLRSLRAWAQRATRGDDAPDDAAQRATAALTLAAALSSHDRRTRGHSERVRILSLLVAEQLGLPDEDAQQLGWAALLHDVGKLTVPSEVLNKPGKPDAREWELLRRHPSDGALIALPLRAWLGTWTAAIEHHHERFDGTGYPHGLAGDQIALGARIVAVTDAFETMTTLRSYRKPMSPAQAREELSRCAGRQFDPEVVRAFFGISLGRLTWTAGLAAWLAQVPFIGVVPRAGARVSSATSAAGAAATPALAGVATVTLGVGFTVGGTGVGGSADVAAASAGRGNAAEAAPFEAIGPQPPFDAAPAPASPESAAAPDVEPSGAPVTASPPAAGGAAPAGEPLPSGPPHDPPDDPPPPPDPGPPSPPPDPPPPPHDPPDDPPPPPDEPPPPPDEPPPPPDDPPPPPDDPPPPPDDPPPPPDDPPDDPPPPSDDPGCNTPPPGHLGKDWSRHPHGGPPGHRCDCR